jgi:hypothetical protein
MKNKKTLRKKKSSVKSSSRIAKELQLDRIEELRNQDYDELEIQRIINK